MTVTPQLEISNRSQSSRSSEKVAVNNISLDRAEYEVLFKKTASYCDSKEELVK